MRAAPSVEAPICAGRVERAVVAALCAAAAMAAVVGAGSALDFAPDWRLVAVAGAAAAGGAAAAWRSPRGRLRWDGSRWWRVGAAAAAQPLVGVQLQIDFGSWLLLRWRGEGERQPTWASLRAADAADWHGLRVALAAHGRAVRAGDSAA